MSVRVMNMVFERYPTGGGEMLLALALADHAHDDGTRIYPTIAQLAVKTRQSERAVQYQLRRMEDSRWLQLVNDGEGGRGMHRQYRINPGWIKGAEIAPLEKRPSEPKGADIAPFEPPKRVQTATEKGCKSEQKRVQTATALNNRIQPSVKPSTVAPGSNGFLRFWNAWPAHTRKAARHQCWQKWKAKGLDAIAERIVAHVEAMKTSAAWTKDGGDFIPAPLVYLNQDRWEAPTDAEIAAERWHESRAGIEAKGVELGLGPWDRSAFDAAISAKEQRERSFETYERRVFRAAGFEPRAA